MKLLTLILLLTGCVTAPIEAPKEQGSENKTEAPVVEGLLKDFWPSDSLRQASVKAIKDHGGALLNFSPKDKAEWCWKNGESAVSFYNRLFSAIAKFESNYKSTTTYLEKFVDGKGNRVVSTGILQVSQESCSAVYSFKSTTETLKVPYNNLACGAKIAAKWIPRHGYIARDSKLGLSVYFSTMRGTGKREPIRQMMCAK